MASKCTSGEKYGYKITRQILQLCIFLKHPFLKIIAEIVIPPIEEETTTAEIIISGK